MTASPADGAVRRSIQASLGDKLKEIAALVDSLNLEIFMLAERCETAEDEAARWRAAFESLHSRLLRDLPGDASELPPPDDEYWARQLDELLTFAAQLAHETETGARSVPGATDTTGD